MSQKPNKYGGGALTNINGLHFEQTTSLDEALTTAGYTVIDSIIYKDNEKIGMSVPKEKLYKKFLIPREIHYKNYNSKKWLPDEAFINFRTETAYIIEKKFQNTPGSVDEKLPNCHFKKMEYEKLFFPLSINVEFIYILNDWFKNPKYKDTLEYIEKVGCYYFYNKIPLEILSL
ncbi:hypothetical protein P261_01562 [Lachnospiraceae bacterium TWA4]|nr:hypothetical protein P261_01562 [Lachnospiraceae bacterium TWA4]